MNGAREFWVEIEEAPRYAVSSWGRVKNRLTDLILKPALAGAGYPFVNLCSNGGKRQHYIHRLVAKAFYDGWSDDLQVNHRDGDKTNNHLANLEWVTPRENIRHAVRLGLLNGAPGRQVRIVETGEIFKSQAECARSIGGRQSSVWLCLNAQRTKHMGYTFEYVD